MPNEQLHNVYLFRDSHDNIVKPPEIMSISELAELFNAHTIDSNKDTLMYSICEYKTKDDDYKPAAYPPVDEFSEPTIIYDPDGGTYVGKYAKNVLNYSALVLDYDDGMPRSAAIMRFIKLIHIGYTSQGNGIAGAEKFRIILPLKTPIPVDELRARKKSILEYIGGADPSTLTISRAFYVPSHAEGREEHAHTWYNDQGELLDWTQFKKSVQQKTKLNKYNAELVPDGDGIVHPETMDIVRFMKDQGLYLRNDGNGKHNVICPCYQEHSHNDKTGTVIYEAKPGEWPSFHCSHSHGFGSREFWSHFKTLYGKNWYDQYCLREKRQSKDELLLKDQEKIKRLFG